MFPKTRSVSFESPTSILKEGLSISNKRQDSAKQIVKQRRNVDAMLSSGMSVGEVLQSLAISEATLRRWCCQHGGMKSKQAKRLKQLEKENGRLKKIVADQALNI